MVDEFLRGRHEDWLVCGVPVCAAEKPRAHGDHDAASLGEVKEVHRIRAALSSVGIDRGALHKALLSQR